MELKKIELTPPADEQQTTAAENEKAAPEPEQKEPQAQDDK